MDKNELETYQVQLSQVELALTSDPNNQELSSLRSELKELIELTKTAITNGEAAASSKSQNARKSSTPGAAVTTWAAGDECLAKYSGDGAWYPARITSVGGSAENRVYSVVFRGYDTTEQLKASMLKPLPPSFQNSIPGSSSTKRKKGAEEDAEKEDKKRRTDKKLKAREAKAKEQNEKQASWQKFAKKSEKKGIHIAGVAGTSIFKTPENPLGKVGVTGSGKGMTENAPRPKNKFSSEEENN
ncbi:hypothetical protein BD410DRAFT_834772 [Rickenella mellea]|uniref:Tudor domain-containing protein n=1 Tax=Rickenella mellea TaxID=50990 RepID=A0A4Y7QP74_9AGAM|nr:hypothetical protein BD410DRAFT_834772 [Rickenella mellea]